MESRHNMLLKALTLHGSSLFFKPQAVSKHSVLLWIVYSDLGRQHTSAWLFTSKVTTNNDPVEKLHII